MQFSAHASFYSSDKRDPKTLFTSVRANVNIRIDNSEIRWCLHHLYQKATAEVKEFQKPNKIARTMVEKQGILYNRSRLMDRQRFAQWWVAGHP